MEIWSISDAILCTHNRKRFLFYIFLLLLAILDVKLRPLCAFRILYLWLKWTQCKVGQFFQVPLEVLDVAIQIKSFLLPLMPLRWNANRAKKRNSLAMKTTVLLFNYLFKRVIFYIILIFNWIFLHCLGKNWFSIYLRLVHVYKCGQFPCFRLLRFSKSQIAVFFSF